MSNTNCPNMSSFYFRFRHGETLIGLFRKVVNGTHSWYWTDGSPIDYTDWDHGEPGSSASYIVAGIRNNYYEWFDYTNTYWANYACSTDAVNMGLFFFKSIFSYQISALSNYPTSYMVKQQPLANMHNLWLDEARPSRT